MERATIEYSTNSEYNSVATYICDSGHEVVGGSMQRRCEANGFWSGIPAVCRGQCMHIRIHSYMVYSPISYIVCAIIKCPFKILPYFGLISF